MNTIRVIGNSAIVSEASSSVSQSYQLPHYIVPKQICLNDDGSVMILDSLSRIHYVGKNGYGMSGLGHAEAVSQLTHVPAYDSLQIVQLFLHYSSCFALNADGELYFTGQSTYGTYPISASGQYYTPTLVDRAALGLADEKFTHVAVCFSSAVGITNSRKAYGFGQTYWFFSETGGPIFKAMPQFLEADEHIVSVSGGFFQAAIITNKNNCYIGGHHAKRFGYSDPNEKYDGFKRMDMFPGPITACVCFQYATALISNNYEAYMSHTNHPETAPRMQKVDLPFSGKLIAIMCGESCQYILTESGTLYTKSKSNQENSNAVPEFEVIHVSSYPGYKMNFTSGADCAIIYYTNAGMSALLTQRLQKAYKTQQLTDVDIVTLH